jgi:hypothetical protein
MRSPLFIFLGIIGPGSDADLDVLKDRINTVFQSREQSVQSEIRAGSLILTLTEPEFRFYVAFEKRDETIFREYRQLARDFEMPWDFNPVNKSRLEGIYSVLECDGYVNYFAHREIAFAILEQMERFKMTTIFTIPSMNK